MTDTPPTQCPYKHLQPTGTPSGGALAEMGGWLNDFLENIVKELHYLNLYFLNTKYIGKVILHTSFHNQGDNFSEGQLPIPSSEHTPLGRMMGEMHAEYRKAAREIGSLLDIESLPQETREIITRYNKAVLAYRNAVLATGERSKETGKFIVFPNYQKITDEKYANAVAAAVEELKQSSLVTASTIPIKTAHGVKWAANEQPVSKQKTGLYLFFLQQASGAQFDYNKVPQSAKKFMSLIGALDLIAKSWSAITDATLAPEIERINQEAYVRIIGHIKAEAHALQMGHLMLAIVNPDKTDAPAKMASAAGIAPYPESLASPLEAAVMVEFLNHAIRPKASQILDAIAMKLNDGERLNSQDVAAVERALEPLQSNSFLTTVRRALERIQLNPGLKENKALALAQKLLMDFLEQYRAPVHPRVAEETSAYKGR